MSSLKIITTNDGSHSLLNEQLNETYHSRHGAVQESLYVFIKHGLDFVSQSKKEIKILEIGFGTGLNALLTAQSAKANNLNVHYTSLEAFPVEENIWSKLNYVDSPEATTLFEKLHRAKWNEEELITPNFKLTKLETTLQSVQLKPTHFDLIYFDAFAPNKQPEMWEQPILKKISDAMNAGGVFVTYCAKGQLKRDLQQVGLTVETLSGPPGKREMVRGVKK